MKWLNVLSAVVFALSCAIDPLTTAAEANASTPDNGDPVGNHGNNATTKLLRIAWILKPPYTTLAPNGSLLEGIHGMIADAVQRHMLVECGVFHEPSITYQFKNFRVHSELTLIEMLRKNEVDIAIPVFEHQHIRKYSEFPFFKLNDYPGTDFIRAEYETKALSVVLESIAKSWPLLAIAVNLSAIAGIVMWALDTYWNKEEFPRRFIEGSWHGFWWSFVSVTTVGYGDKVPKSIPARLFSVFWIINGTIFMAIFSAHMTSTLTALSLDLVPASLASVKVAVLGNGTEYQHAVEEHAHPKVYDEIDDVIQAVKTKEVEGVLLDRYTASYYQTKGKLASLLTLKKLDFDRDVGLLFSENTKELASCLEIFRLDIMRLVQTVTASFKLREQKRTRTVNLFDTSSPFLKCFMYVTLAILLGLLVTGTVLEMLRNKCNAEMKKNVLVVASVNESPIGRRETIREDLETAKQLLFQMQEHFNKLEAEVLRL